MCSVFEFLACEGMNGTTNLAVVDLSPYGFVFKEFSLQTLMLYGFLSFFCEFLRLGLTGLTGYPVHLSSKFVMKNIEPCYSYKIVDGPTGRGRT